MYCRDDEAFSSANLIGGLSPSTTSPGVNINEEKNRSTYIIPLLNSMFHICLMLLNSFPFMISGNQYAAIPVTEKELIKMAESSNPEL
jgi:hypothetical protein